LGRHELEDGERERAERDGAPEPEAVDVDDAPEVRPERDDGQRERDGDAAGRGRAEQQHRVVVRDELERAGLEARDEAESDDDAGRREVVPDGGTGRLRGDGEDDERGEPLEGRDVDERRDGRRECRLDGRDENQRHADDEDAGHLLPGVVVHLCEDDRERGAAAEDEQADLGDTRPRLEFARQHERCEDAVGQREQHHRGEQARGAAHPLLEAEGDRVA